MKPQKKSTIRSFYQEFYGPSFHRHFRRPPDFDSKERKFRVQYSVETPKNLWLHAHRNSGNYPCLASVYDHGSKGNLKRRTPDRIIFDRAFFDFDVTCTRAYELKKELQRLRNHSLVYEKQKQQELQEQLRDLIIHERIAEPAVNEVKDFSTIFEKSFGKPPALFFSGSKGCHAYLFFEPSHYTNLNRTLSWFAKQIKKVYNYETLDLSVVHDATVRLSRVPYSKHQYSLLSVVPFTVNESYDEIVKKALNPQVESFQVSDYLTNFHSHLMGIDETLSHNERIESLKRKQTPINPFKGNTYLQMDHREFFRNLLGEPARTYLDKDYMMYHCPFPDHKDRNPSFRVHKNGYQCYGCQRRGNYFQFLKDYYGWNDEEVKHYLKIKKNRPPTP